MSNLQRRVEGIEERSGMGQDEETVEMPLGNGNVWRMTEKQVANLLRWLQGRNEASGDTCHGQPIEAC